MSSAFWDDYAMEMANDEFVTYFIDACERIANWEIGLVPCQGPHGYETTLTGEWKAYPNPCFYCRAVV